MINILLVSNAYAQDIEIEAADIKGQSGTEVIAEDAILKFGDITLESENLNYDSAEGWLDAMGNVTLSDGEGNLLRTDSIEYYPLLGRAVADGKVEFTTNSGIELVSDLLQYEIEQQRIYLEGNIIFKDNKDVVVAADNVDYDIESQTGTATNITVSHTKSTSVLAAGEIAIKDNYYEIKDASYTTCMMDDPAWMIRADSIVLDENNVVTAKAAQFEFYSQKVFYWPEMSMTFSSERRSGFLDPRILTKSGGEYNVEIPYYLNLAPNYDAIISARFINERGIYSQIEGRSLFADSHGNYKFGLIKDEIKERYRSFYVVNHYFDFPNNFHLDISTEWVNDNEFGDDFFMGSDTAKRHYVKDINFYQDNDNWQYGTRLLHHKTVLAEENIVERPFDTLPGFWVTWHDNLRSNDVFFNANLENFTRGPNDPLAGVRLNSNFVVNQITRLGTNKLNMEIGAAGSYYEVDHHNWIVPYASVELSKKYISASKLNNVRFNQSFEPRIFFGVVVREDFSNIPLYDTDATEFSVNELYQVNSYVGGDRFEDSHLIAYGLDMHMWDNNNKQDFLVARVAQRFRIEDSEIQIGTTTPPEAGFSNLVFEGSLHPNLQSNYKGRLEWNPDLSKIDQIALEAQFLPKNQNAYSVRYTKNTNETQNDDDGQTSFHFFQGVTSNWQVTGDLIYDLEESQLNKLYSGLRFVSNCRCWRTDLYIEREPLAQRDRTTYFFQVSLKGLGGFNSSKFDDSVTRIKQKL